MERPDQPIFFLHRFDELWVHTGTACNLACPFCHEGSKPGDTRLAAPSPAQLAPLLDEAAARGVRRFAFTGGEPLILKGILEILLHALRLRPALVLTNGTAPFIRRAHQLAMLRASEHPLQFQVSIDHPDEARHDAGRGLRTFRKALEGLRLLHTAGFEVGITRQADPGEDTGVVTAQFRQLLRRQHLPEDLPIHFLPPLAALHEVSSQPPTRKIARSDMPRVPACALGRMAVIRGGALRLHACPLTDDAPRFDTGGDLSTALATAVVADHPRCAACAGPGVDYSGAGADPAGG